MDVLQRLGHVDEDVTDVLLEHRVAAGDKNLQIRKLAVLHREKQVALDLAVSEVLDDIRVVTNLLKNLAA